MKNFLLFIFLSYLLIGCNITETPPSKSRNGSFFMSYRDIPGVSDEEIQAVEAIREQWEYLIYGVCPSAEAFIDEDGEIRGFTALFSELLSSLFDIPFLPRLYSWNDLLAGLESGEIAFTGDLTATEERRKTYFMTNPIALRTVKYFRLANSQTVREIATSRPLRYAFLDGTITSDAVRAASDYPIEKIFVDNYENIYEMLKNKEIDAFFDENPAEYVFDAYSDVVAKHFFPLLFSDVSLVTQIPDLEPIVSIVQKMLENGGDIHLAMLYNEGHRAYMRNKFLNLLSKEERQYKRSRNTVSILAEYGNYPTSFFNPREKEWQGIVFDVIKEIEALTGLDFEIVNDYNTEWDTLMGMLESGKGSMISELIRTQEREGRFHWSKTAVSYDYYALLSRLEFENISFNEIFYMTVGLVRGTAHEELFRRWFPNHSKIVEYDCTNKVFEALKRGDIDLVMSSRNQLLYLTNYQEQTGYKINFRFDLPFESTFGFYKGDSLLANVIDKALNLINTQNIHDQWIRKSFDYRTKIAEERYLFLFGIGCLIVCVLILVILLILKKRNEKRLEHKVQKRTLDLKEAVQAAENANRAKSEFLAAMSHEIRTPMNAVIGIAQIQLQKGNLPKDYEEAFRRIHSSGNGLLRIINDILDLSKIEAGKIELIPAQYSIPVLINDAVQLNVVRVNSKQINFSIDADEKLPLMLIGDELRLKQILNNLLSNSVKYTEKGQVKLTVNHSLTDENDVCLRFVVEDTGQGIKPEHLSKLFDGEYQRFNIEANQSIEGTGIGLKITKSLVDMMGGQIEVESAYGKGSRFTVTLIQKAVNSEVIGEEVSKNLKNFSFAVKKDRRQRVRSIMPYGKILVVDDVDTNLYVARGMLAPYQLNVETAASGFLTIDLIKSGKVYDIIFMDHMMPQMDGIETMRELRSFGYNGAIIALTANAMTGNAEMFKQHGFDGFIPKPIDIRHIDVLLNEYVRDRYPEEAKKYKPEKITTKAKTSVVDPKVLEAFRCDVEKTVITLRETIKNNDIKLFTIAVHGIKSALANISENEKLESALALEQAGSSGDIDYIKANTESFIQALEEFIKTIPDSKKATIEDDTEISEDRAYLAKQLKIIKSACEDYDNTAIYEALDLLQEKPWKRETVTVLENIRELVYAFSDFDEAARLVEVILAR